MKTKDEYLILLDNGHGKETPGKRSPKWEDGTCQLFEWKYTRDLTLSIQTKLQEQGYNSVRIVPGENDISLSERANIVNNYVNNSKKICILISVHLNATPNATGWEVWTTTSNNNSDKLAKCFLNNFPKIFSDEKLRGAKEKNFTLLHKANCPCVLTENFFMDSIKDKDLLQSKCGFDKIVQLHVDSIIEYINQQ